MVTTASFCARCGAALPPGAEFCPKCGTPVRVEPPPPPVAAAPPPMVHPEPPRAPVVVAPPPRDRMRLIWAVGIPLSIAILGIVVFAMLRGMPFSGDSDRPRTAEVPQFDTIGEGDARGDDPGLVEAAPPVDTAPPPLTASAPTTAPPPPLITIDTPPGEISEEEAVNVLRGFVASRDTYGIEPQCIGIDSNGYQNAGYTLTVVDRCHNRRLLGRWRVDTKTREVFRQADDGRFLRP